MTRTTVGRAPTVLAALAALALAVPLAAPTAAAQDVPPHGQAVFNEPGSFTWDRPQGVEKITVYLWGPGAGGGGGSGGGGGGGGEAYNEFGLPREGEGGGGGAAGSGGGGGAAGAFVSCTLEVRHSPKLKVRVGQGGQGGRAGGAGAGGRRGRGVFGIDGVQGHPGGRGTDGAVPEFHDASTIRAAGDDSDLWGASAGAGGSGHGALGGGGGQGGGSGNSARGARGGSPAPAGIGGTALPRTTSSCFSDNEQVAHGSAGSPGTRGGLGQSVLNDTYQGGAQGGVVIADKAGFRRQDELLGAGGAPGQPANPTPFALPPGVGAGGHGGTAGIGGLGGTGAFSEFNAATAGKPGAPGSPGQPGGPGYIIITY